MSALEALVLCIARQQRFGLTCREDEFSRADHAKQLDVHIKAMLAEVAERGGADAPAGAEAKR